VSQGLYRLVLLTTCDYFVGNVCLIFSAPSNARIPPQFSTLYLRNETGAEILKELIERPTTFLVMHVCNLGEVYYDFFRDDGLTAAQTAWTNTLALPLTLRRDADDAFIQRVGVIKVEERISFADAFA
jgi:hypothetical protein